MNITFEKLCRRTGGYSLPWLIQLSNQTDTLYFVNNNANVSHGGNTYVATTFDYIPSQKENGLSGGGSLDIAASDANEVGGIISLIQNATQISLGVIGVMIDGGTVSEIKNYSHSYGTVSLDGRVARFTFNRDDRLGMSFPALIFSHYNNRGNA